MGRSFISIAIQAARAADRAARRHQREQLRQARAAERDMLRMEREEKRRYQEDRAAETEALNEELRQDIDALNNLLIDGIGRDPRVDWQSLANAPTRVEPDASLDVSPLPALETLLPPLVSEDSPGYGGTSPPRTCEAARSVLSKAVSGGRPLKA